MCPTCGHTMQRVNQEDWRRVFWCPRCGTLTTLSEGFAGTEAPKLVPRMRKYMAEIGCGHPDSLFSQLGITEAIYPLDRRPTT